MTTDSTAPNDQPAVPASKPKSPWRIKRFSFSLRIMMILVIAIAVPLSWKINSARRQARAIAQIRRMGGSIRYIDDHAGKKSHLSRWMSLIPDCIPGMYRVRGWLGPDFFDVVGEVHVPSWLSRRNHDERRNLESFAAQLANLPKLKSLVVANADFYNEDLCFLLSVTPKLDNLSIPSIYGQIINAKDMQSIAKLTNLMSLNAGGWGKFTDDAIPELAKLRKLQTLECSCDINQSAQLIDAIDSLPNLTTLHLCHRRLSPETDLRPYHRLRSLKSLTIDGVTASDASINELIEALPNLIELNVICSDAPTSSIQRRRDQIRERRERRNIGSTAAAQFKN